MNIPEIVSKLLEDAGLNASQFAKSVNLVPTPIYDLKSGKTKKSDEVANKILSVYPKYNKGWLMSGEGDTYNYDTITPLAPYINENLIYLDYVPVSAMASFVETLYGSYVELEKYGVVPEESEILDEDNIVFQVEGNSMTPTIPNGTKILARKIESSKWENASGVVVVVYGKTLTVKRILKNCLCNENRLILKADNFTYGQVDVQLSEIRGMWQAIRIVSQKIL